MVIKMKYFKYICLFMLFFTHTAFAIVNVKIEPNEPSVNDEFRVIFTYKGQDTNIVPDFSLLDHDFRIIGTGKSTSVSVINGHMTSKLEWIVTLQPKRAGRFLIPSFAFGKDKNETQHITILEGSQKVHPKAGADIFMQTTLDKKESYVQSQLIYTIKLFYARQLASGNFTAPKVNNALILQMGDTQQYKTKIKGRTYQVVEQRYAVFPEKSGKLSISAPLFQGIMQRDNFSDINQLLMNVHKPVKITAADATATIKPIPSNYPAATWLPATKLSLSEESQGFEKPKIGEPITRIIKIRAIGLTAEQLPTLNFEKIKGTNVYPQKPLSRNHISHNRVIGEKTIRVVYIPDNASEVTIPKLSLPWWNLKKNQLSYATLKSKHLKVEGVPRPKPKTAPSPAVNVTPTQPLKQRILNPGSLMTLSPSGQLLLPWTLVFLLTLSWIIHFLRGGHAKPIASEQDEVKKPSKATTSRSKLSKQLKKACVANDMQTTKTILLTWAKTVWPTQSIHALSDIKAISQDASFNSALDVLEKHLYGETTNWQGHGLWVAWLKLDMALKKSKPSKHGYRLPELNPSSK